jgi:hypothetical protein
MLAGVHKLAISSISREAWLTFAAMHFWASHDAYGILAAIIFLLIFAIISWFAGGTIAAVSLVTFTPRVSWTSRDTFGMCITLSQQTLINKLAIFAVSRIPRHTFTFCLPDGEHSADGIAMASTVIRHAKVFC